MTPHYINSSRATSFAGKTLRKRLPAILKSVIKKNNFNDEINTNLTELLTQIPYAPIKQFTFKTEEDRKYWEIVFEEFASANWIDLPFYIAEALFYRQILDCTYWHKNKIDPFKPHKAKSLTAQKDSINALLKHTHELLSQSYSDEQLSSLLKQNLWGNQADLSLFYNGQIPQTAADQDQQLVCDDTTAWIAHLNSDAHQIDFLIDNTGVELTGDICLALYLLKKNKCKVINFHIKAAPIFVSDALEEDIHKLVEHIEKHHPKYGAIVTLFKQYIKEGKIRVLPDLYWNSPLFYDWFPMHIKETLNCSGLVISKGDAHYRRFLQDKRWHHSSPLKEVIHFFKKPLLLLRTLKSEVLAGVDQEMIVKVKSRDKEWLINGKFGLIQFHNFE